MAAVNSTYTYKIDVYMYIKCGVEIWVAEMKFEYPQIVIYCSLEISHESYAAFGQKHDKNPRWPPADISKKKDIFN